MYFLKDKLSNIKNFNNPYLFSIFFVIQFLQENYAGFPFNLPTFKKREPKKEYYLQKYTIIDKI